MEILLWSHFKCGPIYTHAAPDAQTMFECVLKRYMFQFTFWDQWALSIEVSPKERSRRVFPTGTCKVNWHQIIETGDWRGLKWIYEESREDVSGVIYFADDDNTYSQRLFSLIRWGSSKDSSKKSQVHSRRVRLSGWPCWHVWPVQPRCQSRGGRGEAGGGGLVRPLGPRKEVHAGHGWVRLQRCLVQKPFTRLTHPDAPKEGSGGGWLLEDDGSWDGGVGGHQPGGGAGLAH